MAITGKFTVDVRGRTSDWDRVKVLIEAVDRHVKKIDIEAKLEERHFSGFAIILTWTGIPMELGQAQTLFRYLQTQLEKYFNSWKFSININMKESGL